MGYLPQSVKVAVLISDEKVEITSFQLFEMLSGKMVFEGQSEVADAQMWGKQSAYRLNFSAFQQNNFEDIAYFEPFYLKDFVGNKAKKLISGV